MPSSSEVPLIFISPISPLLRFNRHYIDGFSFFMISSPYAIISSAYRNSHGRIGSSPLGLTSTTFAPKASIAVSLVQSLPVGNADGCTFVAPAVRREVGRPGRLEAGSGKWEA